jgi:hypothetical protein
MKHRKQFTLWFFILLALGACTNAPLQKIWVENNKYVVIEVEDVERGYDHTHWQMFTEPEGWTGSGYLVWKGTAIGGHDKESVNYQDIEDARKLTYSIKINNPGVYFLKVRNYHVGKGSGDHIFDGDNDCFISINKSDFGKQYDFNIKEFTWCETGNWRKAYLAEGIHEVSLAGRSVDFGADRICLFHEDLAPEGHFGESFHNWVYEYEWSTAEQSEIMMIKRR